MRTTPPLTAAPTALAVRRPRRRIERRSMLWRALRSTLVWGALLAAIIVAWIVWEPARAWLIAPLVAVSATLVAKAAIEPAWRYRVHRWEITEHAVLASAGWLVQEWRVAPISRIQTVDAVRGPIEQLLGLSTLRVTTASSYGAIEVSGLDREMAAEAVTRLTVAAELTEGDAT